MSDLKAQIQNDMKDAMRSKEATRLGTIRMLLAAVKQREIDERIELDDANILKIINKQIKQHLDSITQFTAAGRTELAAKEQEELKILEAYLPEQLNETEIQAHIKQAIADAGATSVKDMGKVMNALKPHLEGKADMSLVSKLVKDLLTSN